MVYIYNNSETLAKLLIHFSYNFFLTEMILKTIQKIELNNRVKQNK